MRYRREFVTSAPLSWMPAHAEPLRMRTNVVEVQGYPKAGVTSYFYSALPRLSPVTVTRWSHPTPFRENHLTSDAHQLVLRGGMTAVRL